MTNKVIRPLLPAVAAGLLIVSLAACSPAAPAADQPTGSGDAPAADSPAAGGATGCDLVTPDMITAALGVDPGEPKAEASNIAGPDSCTYADIFTSVQVTPEPDVYLSESALGIDSMDGAVEVPGADRGWAAQGGFLIVKGGTGVFVTAFLDDSTTEQWLALAEATLKKL